MARIPPEEIAEITKLHADGLRSGVIAKRFGRHQAVVWKVLNRLGLIQRCRPAMSDLDASAVVEQYKSGASCKLLALEYGVSEKTIANYLRAANISRRSPKTTARKYSLDHNAFDDAVNCKDAAFFVGYLMADGCVHHARLSTVVKLSCEKSDQEILHKFKSFLKAGHPIRLSEAPKRPCVILGKVSYSGPQAVITVTSERLATALARYGVLPRKSVVAKATGGIWRSTAFWSGVCNGDGWVGWQKAGNIPLVGLTGSYALLQQFRRFVHRISGKWGTVHPTASKIFSITYSGRTAKLLAKILFADQPLALSRKRQIATGIQDWYPIEPKLTVAQKQEIARLYRAGSSMLELAEQFGVSEPLLRHYARKAGKRLRSYKEAARARLVRLGKPCRPSNTAIAKLRKKHGTLAKTASAIGIRPGTLYGWIYRR